MTAASRPIGSVFRDVLERAVERAPRAASAHNTHRDLVIGCGAALTPVPRRSPTTVPIRTPETTT